LQAVRLFFMYSPLPFSRIEHFLYFLLNTLCRSGLIPIRFAACRHPHLSRLLLAHLFYPFYNSYMKKRAILSNKTFLYLTEFFAGMSVMAVELGANRLLAPYFSSSQIVWTIIIGTIMIAMALGNVFGGRASDRNPDPDRLYRRIFIAAIWIAAIPLFGKYVILGISALLIMTLSTNLLIWAALFSCLVIFVFPLFLLGTVTPSLIKFTVDSLSESGSIAGRLGAANTIGSIIGTFLPTFVTIPAVGTSVTFLIFSGILLILVLVYFLSGKRPHPAKVISAAVIFALLFAAGHGSRFAFWENNLTYEGESIYNYLQVKEDDQSASLSTNVLFGVQSVYEKSNRLTGMYYDYAMAAPLMSSAQVTEAAKEGDAAGQENTKTRLSDREYADKTTAAIVSDSETEKENEREDATDILVLGNGTGTFATQCERYFDQTRIEGVEIDGKIMELARTYFNEPEDVIVTEYDGRAYLNAIDRTYDVIMVDAFRDITIPFQMSSVEFFTSVRDHLNDGGVMVVNLNMRGDQSGDDINAYLADTISSVFHDVWTVDVPGTTNRELFASNRSTREPSLQEALRSASVSLQREDLRSLMISIARNMVPYKAGNHLMTDDRAPVEMLGMRQLDSIIQDEIGIYKEQLKSGNFSLS
jgi:predicted membrane-bound spermidine synthase